MEDSLFGKPARNFAPRTIWTGDNLDILRGINSETVDLIYLDPPFNSNRTYSAPIGSKAAGAAFEDTWTLDKEDVAWMGLIADQHPAIHSVIAAAGDAHSAGMQSYLRMMAVRLLEMRRVLTPTGSIYLHCDPVASHYLKLLMDAIFGLRNFRNEIVWAYQRWTGATKHFQRMHDILLMYARSGKARFNQLFEPHSEKGRHRHKGRNRVTKVAADGSLQQTYVASQGVKAMRDVWELSYLNANARERIGYPTQKPLSLLNRVIEASSDPGDVVLDPFCGCATACVAADNLQREWVGIDISPKAVVPVHDRRRRTAQGAHSGVQHDSGAIRPLHASRRLPARPVRRRCGRVVRGRGEDAEAVAGRHVRPQPGDDGPDRYGVPYRGRRVATEHHARRGLYAAGLTGVIRAQRSRRGPSYRYLATAPCSAVAAL